MVTPNELDLFRKKKPAPNFKFEMAAYYIADILQRSV